MRNSDVQRRPNVKSDWLICGSGSSVYASLSGKSSNSIKEVPRVSPISYGIQEETDEMIHHKRKEGEQVDPRESANWEAVIHKQTMFWYSAVISVITHFSTLFPCAFCVQSQTLVKQFESQISFLTLDNDEKKTLKKHLQSFCWAFNRIFIFNNFYWFFH